MDLPNNMTRQTSADFLTALPISDGLVTVRPMSDADAQAYAAGTDDAQVQRFAHLPLEKYSTQIVLDMLHGVIADGLRNGTLAVLTIADASSQEFLGSLVIFDIQSEDAEVGYWVAPAHRGRGVSGRALRLSMEIARSLGWKRLRARTVQDNPASEKVLLAAGFVQQGQAQPEHTPSGKIEMGVHYSIAI